MTLDPGKIDRELARQATREIARRRLADFCALMDPGYVRAKHTDLLVSHLEALERREIQNLAVFMPPRHSKSYHVSERFLAWALGRQPKRKIIMASYASELAEKSSRLVRNLLSDERSPFTMRVARDSSAVGHWATDAGGEVHAAGVAAGTTGQGADILSIDDPFADREQADSPLQRDKVWTWYTDVTQTRFQPGGVQILTMTRWHDDDLAGRILNSAFASKWTVLSLPALAVDDDPLGRTPGQALWPAWFPEERLLELQTILGTRSFAALYQQNPIPMSGGTFRSEWFAKRGEMPNSAYEPRIVVQAVDGAWKTGVSNDYSVVATWATDFRDFYLLDVWRGKVEFYDLKRIVPEQYKKHRPHAVFCEEAASGLALLSELRKSSGIPIIGVVPKGSKESRIEAVTPIFEAGRVVLPKSAPWLDEWLREHLRFPGSAHDDQVDTTALALIRLRDIAARCLHDSATPVISLAR